MIIFVGVEKSNGLELCEIDSISVHRTIIKELKIEILEQSPIPIEAMDVQNKF